MDTAEFRKTGPSAEIIGEVLGLRELQAASEQGGMPTVPLLSDDVEHERGILREPMLRAGRPTRQAVREAGARLAHTHSFAGVSGGPLLFGQGPHNPDGFKYRLGSWDLPVARADAGGPDAGETAPTEHFGEFYANMRILPYLPAARANGSIDDAGEKTIYHLCERLLAGDFNSPQPQLVRTPAALLHGDLWSGNIMWVGGHTGTLIDPVAHGGHAETDLATLTIFHSPHMQDMYEAYNEASPLADGWQERIGLHRLHCLILHAALFGGSYGNDVVNQAKHYV